MKNVTTLLLILCDFSLFFRIHFFALYMVVGKFQFNFLYSKTSTCQLHHALHVFENLTDFIDVQSLTDDIFILMQLHFNHTKACIFRG